MSTCLEAVVYNEDTDAIALFLVAGNATHFGAANMICLNMRIVRGSALFV